MKKLLVLTAALLALGASFAFAQGTTDIGWTDCQLANGDLSSFACTETGANAGRLVPTFILDTALNGFQGCTTELRITVGAPLSSTPWWQLAPGGCRDGALALNGSSPGAASGCAGSLYSGSLTPIIDVSQSSPNELKAQADFTRSSDLATPVAAGSRYVAMRYDLQDVGTSQCPGCTQGACIELVRTEVFSGAENRHITAASVGGHTKASWKGGCVTASHSATWGSIKAIYR